MIQKLLGIKMDLWTTLDPQMEYVHILFHSLHRIPKGLFDRGFAMVPQACRKVVSELTRAARSAAMAATSGTQGHTQPTA